MPDAAGAAAVLVSEALVSAALGGGALSCGLHAASPAATPAPARPTAAARLKKVLRSVSIGASDSLGALWLVIVFSSCTLAQANPRPAMPPPAAPVDAGLERARGLYARRSCARCVLSKESIAPRAGAPIAAPPIDLAQHRSGRWRLH